MRVTILALVAFGALACASGSSSTTGPGGGGGGGGNTTGTLSVTVAAPAGITPKVVVLGPGGYRHAVTATATLTKLIPGTYTVVAVTVGTADPIVGTPYAGAVTGSPATIVAGATASATVAYAEEGTPGLLWVANLESNAAGFTTGQLSASGSPSPTASTNLDYPASMVVDASGGVWVGGEGVDTMAMYFTRGQLLAGGVPKPSVILHAPGRPAIDVTALAIDAQGNLWVVGQYSNTVAEYSRSDITATGAPTPAVTITSVFGSIDRPFCAAFDGNGNLWIGNVNDSSLVAYSPTQLSTGGGQVPFAAVTNTRHISAPVGLAFDAAGNLWVAGTNTVAKFTADQLTSVGSPVASVVITLANGGLPQSLAFDQSGDLWVGDYQNNRVVEYAPGQLGTSGSPSPTTTIGSSGSAMRYPSAIGFYPHAAGLPLP